MITKAIGNPTVQKVALYGGGALLLYVFIRGFSGVGKDIGSGAVNLVGGALEGAYEALPDPLKPKTAAAVVKSDSVGELLENLAKVNPFTAAGSSVGSWVRGLFD